VAWATSELCVRQHTSFESKHRAFTIALTGGIASGKTMISDEFARLGVPVIDTDIIAHKLVEPGQPALKEIEDVFGSTVIDDTGRLKRPELRSLIFSDSGNREKLESILHPKIRLEVGKAVAEVESDYCILVIPLLAERGTYPNVDRVLVVDVEIETQISRLMARDNSSRNQAEQALASQASRKQRLSIADDVLENSGSLQQARHKVAQLHLKYLQLSQNL
jgi:dephospho-CoA kinase